MHRWILILSHNTFERIYAGLKKIFVAAQTPIDSWFFLSPSFRSDGVDWVNEKTKVSFFSFYLIEDLLKHPSNASVLEQFQRHSVCRLQNARDPT